MEPFPFPGEGRRERCSLDLKVRFISNIFSGEPFIFLLFLLFFSRYLDFFRGSSLQSMVFSFVVNAKLELTE